MDYRRMGGAGDGLVCVTRKMGPNWPVARVEYALKAIDFIAVVRFVGCPFDRLYWRTNENAVATLVRWPPRLRESGFSLLQLAAATCGL